MMHRRRREGECETRPSTFKKGEGNPNGQTINAHGRPRGPRRQPKPIGAVMSRRPRGRPSEAARPGRSRASPSYAVTVAGRGDSPCLPATCSLIVKSL